MTMPPIRERQGVTADAWYRRLPARRPRNQACRPGAPVTIGGAGLGLGITLGLGQWTGAYAPPIPVVTFLAPLASNFEGLKDR